MTMLLHQVNTYTLEDTYIIVVVKERQLRRKSFGRKLLGMKDGLKSDKKHGYFYFNHLKYN